jgi:hypothetical protein
LLKKLLGIAFLGSLALAQNLVQNPGFETSSFAPWVASGEWSVNTGTPHTGTYYAETGCVGAPCISPDSNINGAWFYQDFTTAPGATYALTFFYTPDPGGGAGIRKPPPAPLAPASTPAIELQVLWGPSGTPLTTGGAGICSGNCVFENASGAVGPYAQFTVTNLMATSSSTRLEFLGRQDPSSNGVDDVVVTLVSLGGVPVPPSIWLTLVGLACVGFYLGFRRACPPRRQLT